MPDTFLTPTLTLSKRTRPKGHILPTLHVEHAKHPLKGVFFVPDAFLTPFFMSNMRTRPKGRILSTHNHDHNCTLALKTTTKEREGGRTRYVCKFSFLIP